jgi:UDP-glucose 4-epimerase
MENKTITCLVIGGNGFIGSHLAERLVENGYSVKIFDNFSTGMENLKTIKHKVEIIRGDFLDEYDVCHALKNVDYVFHYISTTIPSTAKINPIFDLESNVIGSVKLMQSAVNSNVKKILFSSSGGTIYGEPMRVPIHEKDPLNPIDPYGISKMAIEKYLYYFNQSYGLDYTIFRYSNPYGDRQNPNGKQGIIPIFLNKIRLDEQPIIYGDGSSIRDYIYIEDAINATLAVLESRTSEKIFNVGSGTGCSINKLIDIISTVVGKRILPIYKKENGIFVKKVILDISKINNQVNWKPVISLYDGIKRTWDWINRIS